MTAGYYYFSPLGTPFYPGSHNLGSRVWVSDEVVDPPLGEASGPHTYRKGGFPVAFPPAVLVGTPACISDGSPADLAQVGGQLRAGVDTRCWPVGSVPDPSPALWLQPSTLAKLTSGESVIVWPDSSVYGRDAVQFLQPVAPLFDVATFAGGAALFSSTLFSSLSAALSFTGDGAVFAVVSFGAGLGFRSGGVACSAHGTASGAIGVTRTTVTLRAGTTTVTVPGAVPVLNTPALYVLSRVTGVCHLRINGVEIGTVATLAGLPIAVSVPATVQLPSSGVASATLAELQVFDEPLSSAGLAAVESALRAKYGL